MLLVSSLHLKGRLVRAEARKVGCHDPYAPTTEAETARATSLRVTTDKDCSRWAAMSAVSSRLDVLSRAEAAEGRLWIERFQDNQGVRGQLPDQESFHGLEGWPRNERARWESESKTIIQAGLIAVVRDGQGRPDAFIMDKNEERGRMPARQGIAMAPNGEAASKVESADEGSAVPRAGRMQAWIMVTQEPSGLARPHPTCRCRPLFFPRFGAPLAFLIAKPLGVRPILIRDQGEEPRQ